ncbi:MAG: hypothetical protein LHV68_05180 [Elusimicrobia bacterium]|nr:hypothetical protein [Candidatus Liberimonas magnetica]
MARTFDKTVELVERIPDIDTTKFLFRSLMAYLHPGDQMKVIEDLLDYATQKEAVTQE